MNRVVKDKYREQWERLGSSDPYWAVLSDPEMKGGKWNKVDFFASGEREIEFVVSKLGQLGSEISFGVALDFGCGTGRLSRSLAKKFEKVIAIDISCAMLNEAKKENRSFSNIEFLHNTATNLQIVRRNSIDFIYSNIVLQHMPRAGQVSFIKEFCRVLRPGGILVFQTPSAPNLSTINGWVEMLLGNKILNFARKIKYGADGVMELHTLDKEKVLGILTGEGLSILAIEKYDSAGASFDGYRYYATKS